MRKMLETLLVVGLFGIEFSMQKLAVFKASHLMNSALQQSSIRWFFRLWLSSGTKLPY